MSSFKSIFAISILATGSLVAGHGAIIKAVGNAGGEGMALGVNTTTPRDGTGRNPFQQDSTRFKGDAADTFGETLAGGDNKLEAGTKSMMAETGQQLPQVTQGGEISMTLHQVNADGGGPYACMINDDGTGAKWTAIQVTTTVPGTNSNNKAGAKTDFPLKASIPADQSCTGNVAGQQNVCLVRCQNAARAGPFGGVVPVQMAGTSTPAQARRALAMAVAETEQLLVKKTKKRGSKKATTIQPLPVEDVSPELLAELRADGEDI